MKVAALLADRQRHWIELEQLCAKLESLGAWSHSPEVITRFSTLYRSVCADLALADAYQLPPGTVQYLHALVGRCHNQLYRGKFFDFEAWGRVLLVDAPQTVFNDRCVQLVFVLFWGIFLLSAYLAANPAQWPSYAEEAIGKEQMTQLETMYKNPPQGRDPNESYAMAGFYIRHNTGIGLQCFVTGLFIVPGLGTLVFNASFLGGCFGYMARPDVPEGVNFYEFVTAHGPFELTAIVLSAGAGLRLGISVLFTRGWTRLSSLQLAAQDAMPVMGSAMVLFFLAALVEGFVSPSQLPYWAKASVAIISSLLLLIYFVVLGFPRGGIRAAR